MRQTILLLVLLMNIGLVTAQDDGKVDSKYHPVIYLHYDDAGNQDQRFYCYDDGHCQMPGPPGKTNEEPEEIAAASEESIHLENHFTEFPNPTDRAVLIKWDHAVKDLLVHVEIMGYHTPFGKPIAF